MNAIQKQRRDDENSCLAQYKIKEMMAAELQSQAELKEAAELGVDEDILQPAITEKELVESPSESTNLKSETVADEENEDENEDNVEDSTGVNDNDNEDELEDDEELENGAVQTLE
jgi:hypothetical protein